VCPLPEGSVQVRAGLSCSRALLDCPMSDPNTRAERLAQEHDAAARQLAEAGFPYLHIDWRRCSCEDAVTLRALMPEEEEK
jgi:hypothetical protein